MVETKAAWREIDADTQGQVRELPRCRKTVLSGQSVLKKQTNRLLQISFGRTLTRCAMQSISCQQYEVNRVVPVPSHNPCKKVYSGLIPLRCPGQSEHS